MRAYIVCLSMAVVLTVAAFACVDWWTEAEPHPWDYAVELWQTGLGGAQ